MLPSLFRRNSLLASSRCRRLVFLFSSSSTAAAAAATEGGGPSSKSLFGIDYLVNSWGLSAADASEASKSLSHLKSTKKPDAVLNFLRSQGFDGSHLKKIVPLYPRCLCIDVEKCLAPKFRCLRDKGFSESDVVEIILSNPHILKFGVQGSFLPRLEMWETLLGSRELLLRHFKRRRWLVGSSIQNKVQPNLKFLRDECGIPEERVSLVVRKNPHFIVQKPDSLRALVSRAEDLGIPRQSTMFMWTLRVLHTVRKERVAAKATLLTGFGWSDSEFCTAVRKAPAFLCISLENLRRKMEFLVKEAGYTPSCIAHQPMLLLFNLEKKIIPRFRVMEMLKSKGLWTAQCKLLSLVSLPDKKFMEKFVLQYKEDVPELLDILGLAEKGDDPSSFGF